MQRQEELLREQTELMRRAAAERQQTVQSTNAITRDNLSKELLKTLLEDAAFETGTHDDGDVIVNDQIRCFVLPHKDRGTIRLLTGCVFKEEVPAAARFEAANQINVKFVMVRASVSGDVLYFDYDLLLNDGISNRGLTLAVKRFCSIPISAIAEYAADLVQ